MAGIPIVFSIDGVTEDPVFTGTDGAARFTYGSDEPGQDVVTAFPDVDRDGEQGENEVVGQLILQWRAPDEVTTGDGSVTPPPGAPTILLHPDSASPGESVRVLGRGWDPNGPPVHLTLQAEDGSTAGPVGVVRGISTDHSFNKLVLIPDVDPAPYTVVACQRCRPTEEPAIATLRILAPSSVPWGWGAAGLLLLAAAATGTTLWRRRGRPPSGDVRVRRITSMEPVKVELLVSPGDAAHHSIRLVPHRGSGRYEVEELIDA